MTADGKNNGDKYEEEVIIIFTDEEGCLGRKAKKKGKKWDPSKTFGYGISVVNEKDMENFGKVTSDYKYKKGIKGEFKARKVDTISKIFMSWKIRRSGAKTYGKYIDKTKGTPEGWNDKSIEGSELQSEMLRQSLESIILKIPSKNIKVIIDRHTAYIEKGGENKLSEISKGLSNETKRNVVCEISTKKYREQMETNDLVAHAIHDRKQEHNPIASIIMGQKIESSEKTVT